jgi:DNA polymerase III delta subunit
MTPNPRQALLMQEVRARGALSVEALAEQFGVTLQTVRRDVKQLAEAGLLARFHGGVRLPSSTTENIAYRQRQQLNEAAKQRIAKAVAKAGEVLAYDLPKRGTRADLPAWVGRQFAAAGAKVDAATCRLLVELVGDDLTELAGEVEKLVAWANGDSIGEAEIELLVASRAEAPPFALTDSWGRRDVAGVLAASERLLARAGVPPRDALPRIVGLLTSHVTRVAECQALAAEGVPARQAAERMRKSRFYVEKLYEQASNFTPDELRDAIVRLAQLDHALKGGSRLAGEFEFDRALVDLTRPRERATAGATAG